MPGGMFIGTCSAPQPTPGYDTPENINVVRAFSDAPYYGYMEDDTHVRDTFSGVPEGLNSWRWTTCAGSFRFLAGADVNDPDLGGNADDSYVVIEMSQDDATSSYSPHVYIDDISIVIY